MNKIMISMVLIAISFSTYAGQRDFAKLDKNSDGQLSKEEFLHRIKVENTEKMTQVFVNRDKNKDGQLSVVEYTIKSKVK
ncbi:EF-hand domain-containing protein [Thalassotalea sp. SU-HH00458]|uniref:EF-hand domain-containing protein n=1 Tax=Thalassotalea sp. SU-HH00458 TaxID=3127657 RepID=UPI003108A583